MSFTKITNAGFGLTTGTLVGVAASFSSTVSVGGTLTYEDVTNVDSVGLITARNGIEVTDKGVQVGTGATVDSSAANTLTFLTGGSERLSIGSNGRVNIGQASSADHTLCVAAEDDTTSLTGGHNQGIQLQNKSTTDGTYSQIEWRTAAGGRYARIAGIQDDANGNGGQLVFLTETSGGSTAEALRITSAGNVGINETAPAADLVVKQSGNTFTTQSQTVGLFQRSSTTGHSAKIAIVAGNAATSDINFGDTDDEDIGLIQYVHTDNSLRFTTNTSERLRITSSGQLMSGTTTEGHADADDLTLQASSGYTGITLRSATDQGGVIYFSDATSGAGEYDGQIVYSQNSQSMSFATAQSTRVLLDSSGRLLIGTTSLINSSTASNFQIANASGPRLCIARDDTTTASGNLIGALDFYGNDSDGTYELCGRILAEADADHTTDSKLTRLSFYTAGTDPDVAEERLRIDSGGRIAQAGKTPTSHGSPNLLLWGADPTLHISATGSTNNTNFAGIKFAVAGGSTGDYSKAGIFVQRQSSYNDLDMIFAFRATNDSAGVTISDEKLRIDSDGKLLIGTTSDFVRGNLQVIDGGGGEITIGRNDTTVVSGEDLGHLFFASNDETGTGVLAASINAIASDNHTSASAPTKLTFSTTAVNATSPTERMMLDQKGRVDIFASENNAIDIHTAYTGSTGALVVKSGATDLDTGNSTFILYADGDCENTNNSYGALSDQKLKENIVDASSQWNNIKDIRIRNFNFIEGQTHTQIGVVAQQVETVSPGLVKDIIDRDKDGNDLGTVTKSVKYSVLYMKSVKALQEAMARIETLEAKVAALEGS